MRQNSYGKGGSLQNSRQQSALAKQQQIANFYANQPQSIMNQMTQKHPPQNWGSSTPVSNPHLMPNGIPAHFYLWHNTASGTGTTTTVSGTTNTTTQTVYSGTVTVDNNFGPTRSHVDYERMALSALRQVDKLKLAADHALTFELPDGSKLELDDQGNFVLNDKDAKVVYKANRVREFNRFVNASDTLESFVRYAKSLNISQDEFMALPIELFLRWLVVEAAKADGEDTEQWIAELNAQANKIALPPPKPRCKQCKRFIKRIAFDNGIHFCSPQHMEHFQQRLIA